ncbi:hypothetical protein BJ165DRAFT_1407912 [Panaeolus papilionaceus]|nr:hypothetical protein BJ165DRAFT_1407912 [Panaeolus papilionaceus]
MQKTTPSRISSNKTRHLARDEREAAEKAERRAAQVAASSAPSAHHESDEQDSDAVTNDADEGNSEEGNYRENRMERNQVEDDNEDELPDEDRYEGGPDTLTGDGMGANNDDYEQQVVHVDNHNESESERDEVDIFEPRMDPEFEFEPEPNHDESDSDRDIAQDGEGDNDLGELDQERQQEEQHIQHFSMIESLEISQHYIESIRNATLENSGLSQQTIEELRNPGRDIEEDLHDPDTRLALDIFISCLHASEATYNNVTKATARRFPEIECHSYYSIRKLFERATGVVALTNDMCINGCHAFTDADANLEECRKCGECRYDQKRLPKKVPRKTFCTLPLGPQIQALCRSPDRAIAMEYQYHKFRRRQENGNDNTIYDDIQAGSDVQELFESIGLTPNDTTLIFSLDGAQLYQNKQSDTWIAIWILLNYSPKVRYQKKNEGQGLAIWNAHENRLAYSRLILLLGTADAVGLTELDSHVGHHGAHGCRLGSDMEPDFDFRNPAALEPHLKKYDANIEKILRSTTQGEYEENRKDTGLSKLSLLSGLDQELMLPVPSCFSVDLMHLIFINLGELLIPLWCGTLLCEPSDNKGTWDWATLTGDTWAEHGQLVADATKYFPSSFHRPPQNPAEKISSGYKATEYYLYLFGLGPALFRIVLPTQYYLNFCRLVEAVHIILQCTISTDDLLRAHSLLVQFVEEYENLYYQRRPDRLHMCRPCLPTLLHVVFEVFRKGPGALDSQFTLERTIGDLGSDIRQPSNPFGNLIQLALRLAQINALYISNFRFWVVPPYSIATYGHSTHDSHSRHV